MVTPPARILVARSDKLGDFMLIWPALALLRRALPDAYICVLVSGAAEPMAHLCPFLDDVLVDKGQAHSQLARDIGKQRIDVAVALFSTMRVAAALRRSQIPYRLAPATKLAQWLFNQKLVQRRSQSIKPEHAYNVDLIRRLLEDFQLKVPEMPSSPYLQFPASALIAVRDDINEVHGISDDAIRIIVHPGSGGSASNLSCAGFAGLVNRLCSDRPVFVVVTAGPGEQRQAQAVKDRISRHKAVVHISSDGLTAFAKLIATAHVFISGSTGPLHIAGALDIPTAAFYPRRRSSTALRWQTTNQRKYRLAFSPPTTAAESEMGAIDLDLAASNINCRYLNDIGN